MNQEELSQQVFDSLFEEMITGKSPPDLSARILAAIDQAGPRRSDSSVVGSTATGHNAQDKSNMAIDGLSSSSLHRTVTSPQGATRSDRQRSRANWGWVLVLAASTLIAFYVGWRWINNQAVNDKVDGQVAGNNDSGLTSPAVRNAPKELVADSASEGKTQERSGSVKPAPERIDTLPFELDSNVAENSNPGAAQTPDRKSTKRLSNSEIVAALDQHLAELWKSMDVQPSDQLESTELAQRISQALTGYELSDAEVASLVDEKKQTLRNKSDLIQSGTSSMAFQRLWSQKLVQYWTGRPQGDVESRMIETLASKMREEKRWNFIVADMLGGKLDSEESVSNQFLSLFAGGENHQLVECIGRGFMNQQLACMKCHRQPDAENSPANQQSAYWSLVALLKGLEGRGSGKLLNDRQAELFALTEKNKSEPGVYFELPNGALKQAYATLPNGKSWRAVSNTSPRQALAEWIKDSQQLDQATVNTVWQLVFGRPLLPQNSGVDAVALEQRQQMLQFLAEQFDLADHDFGQLVGWVVSCRAFAVKPNPLTRDQWQDLNQQRIDQWQLADWTFATGPKTQQSSARNRLQENLKYVVGWRTNSKPQPVLSQPSPDLIPSRNPTTLRSQRPTFSSSFAVHGQRHTVAEEAFIDRLMRSEKLTWQERVQHVIGLVGPVNVNDDLQLVAKDLLQFHSGDSKAALLDILWAAQSTQL